MTPRKVLGFVLRLNCWLITLVGCLMQIYYVSDQYFAYGTVTQVTIEPSYEIRPPTVILCTQSKFQADNLTTTEEVFRTSPTADEFRRLYTIHEPEGFGFLPVSNNTENLIIKRIFKQNDVCYSMTVNPKFLFITHFITNGYRRPVIYTSSLNNYKRPADVIMIYIHPNNLDWYGVSDKFLVHDRKLNSRTGLPESNVATISYATFVSHRLPPPYITNCIDYQTSLGFESSDHCYETCDMKMTIQKLGKVPFTVLSLSGSNYKLLSELDVKNKSVLKELDDIYKSCSAKCPFLDCVQEQYIPRRLSSGNWTTPTVTLMMSSEPRITTQFKPQINPVDYITYVLSCVSFWLAWSPLDFLLNSFVSNVIRRRLNNVKTLPDQTLNIQNSSKDYKKLLRIWKRQEKETRLLKMNFIIVNDRLNRFICESND